MLLCAVLKTPWMRQMLAAGYTEGGSRDSPLMSSRNCASPWPWTNRQCRLEHLERRAGPTWAIIWAREGSKTRQEGCRAFKTRVTYRQRRGFQVARKRVGVFQKAKGLAELGRSS